MRLARTVSAVIALLLTWQFAGEEASAQERFLSGTASVIRGDGPPGSGIALARYVVADDQGRVTELDLSEAQLRNLGGPAGLDRRRVTVIIDERAIALDDVGSRPAPLRPLSIQLDEPAALSADPSLPMAVSGSQPWVTILCRFSDSASVTPQPRSYFENLMGSSRPGMDHFWREVSYDNVNLTGSVVAGWYDLPRPRSDYVFDDIGMPGISFDGLAQDCTGVADADVFFPDFAGIHLVFNDSLDCCAWGGAHVLDRDGLVKTYSTTWMPPFAYENQSVMGHEMGHGFGLPHSSGPYATPYDSKWDVMSTGGICSPSHAEFGCLGVHTVAHHMDLMGWIPPSRQYVAIDGSRQSITLEPLGGPISGDGYLMAKVPIAGSGTEFYTVEARRFVGYDDQTPGEAILINRVDSTRGDRQSQVVDPDGNGDPNDGAAMWLPGETFTDDTHDITISVDGSSPSGFQVTLSSGAACGFSIDPTTAFFPLDGGAGVVTVTADARCDWTAESHAAWIHVDSPSGGAGDGINTYIVDVNPGSARSSTMTIAGLTFSVEQEGSFNLPPSIPSSPSPTAGEIDVSTVVTLSWTGGDPDPGDTVTYDVHFGTSIDPPLASFDQPTTSCDPDTLVDGAVYYWRVVAHDSEGATSNGPMWSFRTASALSCVDAVADGGFEDGTPSPHWSEFSSNFLTPLCDGDTCGSAFARTGDWTSGSGVSREASRKVPSSKR